MTTSPTVILVHGRSPMRQVIQEWFRGSDLKEWRRGRR